MKLKLATTMNRGRHILVSTLVAGMVTAGAGAQGAPAVSPAEARQAIQASYVVWGKARPAVDMPMIEKILAPDFYVLTPERKYTRQEFIDTMANLKITRYDASVLTVEPKGNDWSVVIAAKVEVDAKDKDGKTSKQYRVSLARDGWRKSSDNQWVLISSEPVSQQRWTEIPPIANWNGPF